MAHHVHNTRMRTAHQQHQTFRRIQGQADLVPEVIPLKARPCPAAEPLRDGFHRFRPGKAGEQICPGKYLPQAVYALLYNVVILQKFPVKGGGQVRVNVPPAGVLRLKEAWAGIEAPGASPLPDQIRKARGMVIVAVAEYHGIQVLQVDAQLFRVAQKCPAAAAVEQNLLSVPADIHGQPMLRDQVLPPRVPVIQQRQNLRHGPALLSVFFIIPQNPPNEKVRISLGKNLTFL